MSGAVWGKRIAIGAAWIGLLVALDTFVTPSINRYQYQILVSAAVNIALAVSLQLINGITGQFSIGHAGFMAVGGYAAGMFSLHAASGIDAALGDGGYVSFAIALLVGAAFAGAAGFLVGAPSLRLRGDYLAIVTLGFGEIIRVLIQNNDALGGALGRRGIPPKTNFVTAYVVASLVVLLVWNVYRSSYGRAMLSVREDEIAADAMGVGTTRTKILAFVISSALAGLAGGLFAHLFFLSPASFTFVKSIEIVMMIIIGGLGSVTGAVVGGAIMTGLPEWLRDLKEWRMVVYSLLIILIIRFRPQGLFGLVELPDAIAARLAKKKASS